MPESEITTAQIAVAPSESPRLKLELPRLGRSESLGLLFAIWSDHPGPEGPCRGVGERGLKCQNYRGSWDRLVRLNVPSVLEVSDETKSARFLVIEKLNGSQATIRTPEGPREVSVDSIREVWSGRAVIAYRLDLMDRKTLRPGGVSPLVPWIRKQLSLEAVPFRSDANRYDEDLRARVRMFQSAMGLRSDGLVGALTLIGLQGNGPDPEVPRLRMKNE